MSIGKPLVAQCLFAALCLFPLCLAAGAQDTVTVAQLEKSLAADHGKSDKDLAQHIAKMELTQRLATSRLARLQADLPGEKSRLALMAVADAAAFRALPAEDILPTAPPDRPSQKGILTRAIDFVSTTVPRMPNFFATRDTTRLESVKPAREVSLDQAESTSDSSRQEPFRVIDTSLLTVQYREGKEAVENPDVKKGSNGLTDWGEFGPLLGLVMTDILAGRIGWLHWEQGSDGPVAVFRYKIDTDRSHYIVRYCCLPEADPKKRNFETVPAYDGEIAIDPKSGSVLRLVLETELDRKLPIKRDDLAVEYGPVQIGGVSYICPLKSISITHVVFPSNEMSSGIAPALRGGTRSVHVFQPAETTAINDTAFTNYHRFRAELRIVPESPGPDSPVPDSPVPDSPAESAPEATPPVKPPAPPHR